MKKFYVLFLLTMVGLTASAQKEEWRLDRSYVENDSKVKLNETVYEYNENRWVSLETETNYQGLIESVTKTYYEYDEKGNESAIKVFEDDTPVEEMILTEYDEATGYPKVYLISYSGQDALGNYTGQLLPYLKYEFAEYSNGRVKKLNLYLYDETFDSYELAQSYEYAFDEQGRAVQELMSIMYEGTLYPYLYTETEYDNHDNRTKEVVQNLYAGTTTTYYTNSYDDNDCLVKVRIESSDIQVEPTTKYNFWSRFDAAGVSSIRVTKGISDWYDMNGRRLDVKPTKKGLFIQNGKKVLVK